MFLLLGPWFISFSRKTFQNKARAFTPENHQSKANTPTMGGALIIAIVICNLLLWCNWNVADMWLCIITLLGFGAIGLFDDISKIWYKQGISARKKFFLQLLMALIVILLWIHYKHPSDLLSFPIFKNRSFHLGWLLVPWTVFIIVAMSNAVNLTDGLDGLAAKILLQNFSSFTIIAYASGYTLYSYFLKTTSTQNSEITLIASILTGATLGFLWFNSHPAHIFMGDVGSLSLGAILALIAIMLKQELLLPIAGGIFVFEVISVIGQYLSVKYAGKRLFKMAPVHHHFELLGWKESKVTARFTIISSLLCLLSLIIFFKN